MTRLSKQAFYNNLRGFMQADRADYMRKRAASPADIPPELLQQVQQPMPGPSPEELAAMQQGAPGPEGDPSQAQGPAQPQSEKLNIQAIGPDAIDAIKGMMGNQVAEVAAANPEGIKMASFKKVAALNKYAAFQHSLRSFMQEDRARYMSKKAQSSPEAVKESTDRYAEIAKSLAGQKPQQAPTTAGAGIMAGHDALSGKLVNQPKQQASTTAGAGIMAGHDALSGQLAGQAKQQLPPSPVPQTAPAPSKAPATPLGGTGSIWNYLQNNGR